MKTEEEIDQELQAKAEIMRDGARGWRLSECLIEDALDLLQADEAKRAENAIPSEDDEDYMEIVEDTARDLENELAEKGYTVIHNDGYVIYKDLSEEALAALENV